MCKNEMNDAGGEVLSLGDLPMLLKTTQAATILNVTPRTVQLMCEAGKLKAVRVQSVWRVNRDALLEFAGLEVA